MIKAVIIDDEPNALEVLEIQINKYCKDVQIVACALGGAEGIAAIIKHQPQLVFLDIEMPHVNGFEVLKQTSGLNYKIIFTTAYNEFAIKAFKYSTVDYLLKPIDIIELQNAVEKVKETEMQQLQSRLQQLLKQYEQPKNPELIALQVGDALQLFKPMDIIRCESESNYTYIYLSEGKKVLLSKTLKEIEESLQGLNFYRVHQSHLVNMAHVSKVYKGENAYIVLSDNSQIVISRYKKEGFFELFRRL